MRRFRLSSGKSYIAGVFIFKQFQLYLQKTSVARHLFPPLLLQNTVCVFCLHELCISQIQFFFSNKRKKIGGGGANVYINIYYGKYKYLFQKIIMMNQILCSFPLLKYMYIIRQIMYIHVYVANKNKQYTVYVIYYSYMYVDCSFVMHVVVQILHRSYLYWTNPRMHSSVKLHFSVN